MILNFSLCYLDTELAIGVMSVEFMEATFGGIRRVYLKEIEVYNDLYVALVDVSKLIILSITFRVLMCCKSNLCLSYPLYT